MPVELKTEMPKDAQDIKPMMDIQEPDRDAPPCRILPPPIPGQTAWSIVPW